MAKCFKSMKRQLIISDHCLDLNTGLNDVCTRKRGFGTLCLRSLKSNFAPFGVILNKYWGGRLEKNKLYLMPVSPIFFYNLYL